MKSCAGSINGKHYAGRILDLFMTVVVGGKPMSSLSKETFDVSVMVMPPGTSPCLFFAG